MKGVSNGKVIDADKEYAVGRGLQKEVENKMSRLSSRNVGNLSGGNQQKSPSCKMDVYRAGIIESLMSLPVVLT